MKQWILGLCRNINIYLIISGVFFTASVAFFLLGTHYLGWVISAFYPKVDAPDNWALALTQIIKVTGLLFLLSSVFGLIGFLKCSRELHCESQQK